MMTYMYEILAMAALTALSVLAPFAAIALRRLAALLDKQGWLTDQQRLGNAAARIAARMAAEVATNPDAIGLTQQAVDNAAVALGLEFRETVVKRGINRATLETILRGELAKLGQVPR